MLIRGGDRRAAWVLVLAALTGAGCIGAKSTPCGDAVCPSGAVCYRDQGEPRCALPPEISACDGLAHGARCEVGSRVVGHHCDRGICVLGRCGDGVVDDFESCDEGDGSNSEAPDATCRTNCQRGRCGDGVVDTGEVCDDGGIDSGDGCSGDCRSDETCGNGYVDFVRGEECDDGNLRSLDGCSSHCQQELAGWFPWQHRLAEGRFAAAGAFDEGRGVLVIFGGNAGSFTGDTTWEYDGIAWRHIAAPTRPPRRANHVLVYDVARQRTVLFGGSDGAQLDDTWEYDGTTWTAMSPATSPSARRFPAAAYDRGRQVVVLFGGNDGAVQGDTWQYDGTTWTAMSPPTAPTARYLAAMASDPGGGVMLVGGYRSLNTSAITDEAWRYDGTTWTAAPALPEPRGQHQLAADGSGIFLFGGRSDSQTVDTHWRFDGTTWQVAPGSTLPTRRYNHVLAYDSARSRLVAFGGLTGEGILGDTWEYDGADWSETTPGPPPARYGHAIAYDRARSRGVVFGGLTDGIGQSNDTWETDAFTWVPMDPLAATPPPRFRTAMVYDAARQRIVLFGGDGNGTPLGDTWEYDGTTWIDADPAPSPPARIEASLAYDAARQRVVLFGGQGGTERLGDTWEYDGAQWTDASPLAGPSPSPRRGAFFVYDARREITVLFGGRDSASRDDTWEWDGTGWVEVATNRSPGARYHAAGAYDPIGGVIWMTGGLDANSWWGDLWRYDGYDWREVSPPLPPSPRYFAGAYWDSARARLVMFGGQPRNDETWELTYQSAGATERCDQNGDVDGDGLVGCDDPDCNLSPSCAPVEDCDDGVDNDGDGLVDCADPNCGGFACGAGRGYVCFAGTCQCPACP